MVATPLVLIAHPSLPVKNVRDLARLARTRPGQVNYASAGVGNLAHIAMESLSGMAGIRMNHIPYKGSAPALVDIMAGHVELMFINILGLLPHVQSGRVRAVAVSSAKRASVFPDTPSVAEAYPEYAWIS